MNKAGLFLMEQIIVIAVFAICSAVCVKIFAGSYMLADSARDLKNAILLAENAAEGYKAASGNYEAIESGSVFYFDENLRPCAEASAKYSVVFSAAEMDVPSSVRAGVLSVRRLGGDELISFTVAARGEPFE